MSVSTAMVMASGCANTKRSSKVAAPQPERVAATAQPETVAAPKPKATMDLTVVDGAKVDAATVILRVELVEARGGSKYHWDSVRPLKILKNDSDQPFDSAFDVAHYGWNKGVPTGTSTIYLEAYGEEDARRWRLLGSDGALGVSHHQP